MVAFDENSGFAVAKRQMLERDLMGRDITDEAVLDVMCRVPREEFMPGQYSAQAYADKPLPIGLGQTISQPYIVALMTQHLKVDADCDVLELGTGCGYQTMILAKLAKKVYTIERYNQLAESAQNTLGRLGVENVEFYVGDGSAGWPEERSFDRIIVTAAVPAIAEPLKHQLKEGGLLVAPVGGEFCQELIVCQKKQDVMEQKSICPCRFVKLIGECGFSE